MERETVDEEDSIRNENSAQGNLNPVMTSIDGKICSKGSYKVGCVLHMGHVDFGRNNHREDASHFTTYGAMFEYDLSRFLKFF